MALLSFPEPTPLNKLEIGASNLEVKMDEALANNKYSPSNPHPGYGSDPNIINEYGHTAYPKWVTDANGERIIANSHAHEAELTGNPIEMPKKEIKKPTGSW